MSADSVTISERICDSRRRTVFLLPLIYLFFSILSLQNVCPDSQTTVAIVGFIAPEEHTGLSEQLDTFRDFLTATLSHGEGITLVERQRIEKVLKECELSLAGIVDERELIRAGRMLGAEILIYGEVKKDKEEWEISIRFLQPETGKILKLESIRAAQRELTKAQGKFLRIIKSDLEEILSGLKPEPKVIIAVSSFENKSLFDRLDPWEKGLVEFITKDFSQVRGFQLVEREHLDKILEELELTKAGLTEEETGQRPGKALPTVFLVTGEFEEIGGLGKSFEDAQVKVEVQLRDMATGTMETITIQKKVSEFYEIEREIVEKVLDKIKDIPVQERQEIDRRIEASLYYRKGVELLQMLHHIRSGSGLRTALNVSSRCLSFRERFGDSDDRTEALLREVSRQFEKVLFLCPDDLRATLALGVCLDQPEVGEHDKALSYYEKVYQNHPGGQLGFTAVEAAAESYNHNRTASRPVPDQGSPSEKQIKEWKIKARQLYKVLLERGSQGLYEDISRGWDDHLLCIIGDIAQINRFYLHDYRDSLSLYRKYRRELFCVPDTQDYKYRGDGPYGLIKTCKKLGNMHAAISILEECLKESPTGRSYFYLGRCYRELDNYAKAIKSYCSARSLFETDSQEEKAIWDKAYFFEYVGSLTGMASCLAATGDKESAVKVLEEFLAQFKDGTVSHQVYLDASHVKKREFINYTVKEGLNYPVVQAIAVDGNDIWFSHLPRSFLMAGGWKIRDFYKSGQANFPGGLSRFNKHTQQWKSYSKGNGLSCNLVTSIAVDKDSVWVGTYGGGLNRYIKSENRWICYTEKNGLPYNYILSLANWKDELWLGLGRIKRGALAICQKKEGEFNLMTIRDKGKGYKERAPENCVIAISPNDKEVWVDELAVGLKKYDRKTQNWTTFQHKFNYETGKVEGIIDIYNRISSLSQDGKRLWIGTYYRNEGAHRPRGAKYWDESNGGVNSYGLEDDRWGYFTTEDGLLSDCILSVAVGEKHIWFGEMGVMRDKGGVSCYNKETGTWSNFSVDDGLISGKVLSVAVDTDSVWIGTEVGVSKLIIREP